MKSKQISNRRSKVITCLIGRAVTVMEMVVVVMKVDPKVFVVTIQRLLGGTVIRKVSDSFST